MGTRLGIEYSNKPKCFVDFFGKKLIEIQLDCLIQQNFDEAIIVIGHQAQYFSTYIGSRYKSLNLHYITNKQFESTGSAQSLSLTSSIWRKYQKNFLMLHADIYYENTILSNFCSQLNIKKNYILLDENFVNETNDEQVVIGDKKIVNELIKGKPKADLKKGESLGVNYWTIEFMDRYFDFLKEFLVSNKTVNWEQTIKPFLQKNHDLKLFYMGIGDKFWKNINYQEDLIKAKQIHKTLHI